MKHRSRLSHVDDHGLRNSASASTGLLSEGVFESNIERTVDGGQRVALWREWSTMLDDLRDVGQVWSIVRNGHCVLAVQGNYPLLAFSSDQLAAHACNGESSLSCDFRAWERAFAFESPGCRCRRTYGVEIENSRGQVFHRICLSNRDDLPDFAEWTQMHQATGLEEESDFAPLDKGRFHPQSFGQPTGMLQVAPHFLRTVMISAAEREIPLIAGVISEGASQTVQLEVLNASETHGWLVLSGERRSLYVESEPQGSLFLEPGRCEGETVWKLSLVNPEGHRLLRLQCAGGGCQAWNQLIRGSVLCAAGI
jgi:putative heme degradation protein